MQHMPLMHKMWKRFHVQETTIPTPILLPGSNPIQHVKTTCLQGTIAWASAFFPPARRQRVQRGRDGPLFGGAPLRVTWTVSTKDYKRSSWKAKHETKTHMKLRKTSLALETRIPHLDLECPFVGTSMLCDGGTHLCLAVHNRRRDRSVGVSIETVFGASRVEAIALRLEAIANSASHPKGDL